MVHEVAAEGFGNQADVYERARPTYPDDAVDWLVANLPTSRPDRVVDLAAGTGKLTRLLTSRLGSVVAVEPVAAMRTQLRRTTDKASVVAGTAERLPFASGSLDAVTVAQAFHWFDHDHAVTEIRRALRIGGRLAMVWNARDRSEPWVDALWEIMDRVEKRAPWRDHTNWREQTFVDRLGFTALTDAEFRHEQPVAPDEVVERVASVSHVAVLPATDRERVLDEVRALLSEHPDTAGRSHLAIPYRVDAMWCERSD